jgi:hypothetical protein
MRPPVPATLRLLSVFLLAGCAAAQVAPTPDASRVTIGTSPPQGPYEQLGTITATHGGGCGLYGARGSLEGAYTILRNKAAQLGADYVQILRLSEPHVVPGCSVQAFVLDGLAYKRATAAPGAPRLPSHHPRPGLSLLGSFGASRIRSVPRIRTPPGCHSAAMMPV